jgi:hypothetical protein
MKYLIIIFFFFTFTKNCFLISIFGMDNYLLLKSINGYIKDADILLKEISNILK